MGTKPNSSPAAERMHEERVPEGDDRSNFERDRDIILYTSAFKRLSGITQVTSSQTGHVFHNRLTHSLQVAQVGRSLAQKLHMRQPELAKAIDLQPFAVEAGCLAHDLGHPPFGHVAEEALNSVSGARTGGFEGNAQSFRIITQSAFRSPVFNGLNLTKATLRSVLKYPWTFRNRPGSKGKKSKKWGAYDSELPAFRFATGLKAGGRTKRSVEAELMDWSDDLTYAVHDVDDFYRAGLIPLHQLRPPLRAQQPDWERTRFLEYVWARREKIPELKRCSQDDLDGIFSDVIFAHFTISSAYEGIRDHRARLRSFTSRLVDRYINGLKLRWNGEVVTVDVDVQHRMEVAILKQLTWLFVIEAPALALQQHAQREMILYLYDVFMEETKEAPSNLLPPYYREKLKEVSVNSRGSEQRVRRIVTDLIAGMTEGQAVAMYQRLHGFVMGSALDKVLV